MELSLKEFIDSNRDLIAYFFPCEEENYKEVLDRYFFIGITERMQESFDVLADLIGKRHIKVELSNTTEKDSQISMITEDFVEEFKEKNKLDYTIYNYCVEKFEKLKYLSKGSLYIFFAELCLVYENADFIFLN